MRCSRMAILLLFLVVWMGGGCAYRNWELQRGEEDYARLTLGDSRSANLKKPVPPHDLIVPSKHGKDDLVVANPYVRGPAFRSPRSFPWLGHGKVDPPTASGQMLSRPGGRLPEDVHSEADTVTAATVADRVANPPRLLLGGNAETHWVGYPGFPWPIRAFRNELMALDQSATWNSLWEAPLPEPETDLQMIWVRPQHRSFRSEVFGQGSEVFGQSHVTLQSGRTQRLPYETFPGFDDELFEQLSGGDTVAFVRHRSSGYLQGPIPSPVVAVWVPYKADLETEEEVAARAREAENVITRIERGEIEGPRQPRFRSTTRLVRPESTVRLPLRTPVALVPYPSRTRLVLESTASVHSFASAAAVHPFPKETVLALASTMDGQVFASAMEPVAPIFMRRWTDSARLIADQPVGVFTSYSFHDGVQSYDEVLIADALPPALRFLDATPYPDYVLHREDGVTVLAWNLPASDRGFQVACAVAINPWYEDGLDAE